MDAETDSVHGSGWVNRPAIVYACAFAPDLNQDLLDSPERDTADHHRVFVVFL